MKTEAEEMGQTILCKCGCGTLLNVFDARGRMRCFVSGHNQKGNFSSKVLNGRAQAQRIYRDIGFCSTSCGSKATHRHHKDGNPTNNSERNIEFLCASCHAKHHDFLGTWARSEASKKENSPSWRSDITEELLLDTFNKVRSLSEMEKVLNFRHKSIAQRLKYYGYSLNKQRAKTGYGWDNKLVKVS